MANRTQKELIVDIKKLIEVDDSKDGRLLPACCIYRVPPTIRYLNEKAYTPKFTSIGPFHYDDKILQDMEEHKKVFFKEFTQRAMSSLGDLVSFVKHTEPKVRASYSDSIKLSEEELVKLILVDAGFIIELFIRYHKFHDEIRSDAKLSQPWLIVAISMDLVLLENQLPFFVIKELFNKAFPNNLWAEILVRNMIALEQRHYPYESYIMDYVFILDCLINTHKDVDVLVQKKIVSTRRGDTNNVATVVHGLCINVIQTGLSSEYMDICQRLNGFCEDCWHKKKAALRLDYCRTPWQIIVSIAGIIFLILSVVQTIFSILQEEVIRNAMGTQDS
ncbi:uncharacterized protein LOC129316507 [Prosopis cineraria]|uniref:uncharacterized protein LOC129316507 n=1 Tax=Prosopis cineraria TaxID=364024 RepID=UPI00240F2781|nr:uncharacterized protein LOC129316507 [Prosopis cineraria]